MSFSFSSLIRLMVLLAVGSTILAVGVSRLEPPRSSWRARRPTRHVNINEYFLDVIDRTPRWLDVEDGRIEPHPLADGDVLEAATCSPWVDEQGRRQVVGRWSSRTKDGPMSMSRDFGLARYTFPGGELIEQVSTEIVPVGPPSWYPGTRARILFAAGDGLLYHFAFEPEEWLKDQVTEESGRDPRPRPMTWRCPKPGLGEIFMSDLTWPDDPRMGGCVVVALREQELSPKGHRGFTRTQLWWLKLNHAGSEIVEAGRLVMPGSPAESDEFDERSPTVGALPDGRLAVAYLKQQSGDGGWQLRVAPIEIQPGQNAPIAFEKDSRILNPSCQPAHPAFSPDGRWISAITGATPSEGRVTRLSTAGLRKADDRS